MTPCPFTASPRGRVLGIAALMSALIAASAPALALYKVENPDGTVTYTDRPPVGGQARITSLGAPAAETSPTQALPLALRQVAQRYPVTLYTSTDCDACEEGRRMLKQRGVPFSERSVSTDDDAQALERTVGARMVPSLSIGTQGVRGYSSTEWAAYLDAAGYPRESQLPSTWQAPPVRPMVERNAVARRPASGAATTAVPPAPAPAPTASPGPGAGGIRF